MKHRASLVIAAAAILIVAACAARSERVLARGQAPPQPDCSQPVGRPLPDTTALTVGPGGDELKLGPHRLEIEAGALPTYVPIRFVEHAGSHLRVSIESVNGDTIRFARPATLTLNLRPRCPSTVRPKDVTLWRVDANDVGEGLATQRPWFTTKVRTRIDHNSFYIVAD